MNSFIIDGCLDFDALLAKDDIDLYNGYKDYPATPFEVIVHTLQNGTPREQLAIALEYKINNIIELIVIDANRDNDPKENSKLYVEILNKLAKDALEKDKKRKNCHQYVALTPLEEMAVEARNKRLENKVTFKKILNNKSLEFFEIAAIEDKSNLDWTLVNVDPTRFDVLKILFDNGAKIHKKYLAYDEDGDYQTIDEIDEIATAIRREEINRLLGVKN